MVQGSACLQSCFLKVGKPPRTPRTGVCPGTHRGPALHLSLSVPQAWASPLLLGTPCPSGSSGAPQAAEQRSGLSVPSFPVSSSSLQPGLLPTGLPTKTSACRALSPRVLIHWAATRAQACACSWHWPSGLSV